MKKIIILGGPTATGKTKYAVELAKQLNGELINADSRQLYKYLDIGTNKGEINLITETQSEYETNNIPIHLVNIINPDKRFDLFRFQQLAFKEIENILNREKLPIIVGGTGLYIDSIIKNYELKDIDNNNLINLEIRAKLESLSVTELQNEIFKINNTKPNNLNNSDWNNPRRLIRYIENLDINVNPQQIQAMSKYNFLFLYPEYNWEELKNRINDRVISMFETGLVKETKKVLEMGFNESDPGLKIMGYKESIKILKREINEKEAIEMVQNAHKQYARRQRTWFESRNRNYNLIKFSNINEAIDKAKEFLNQTI